MAVPISSGMASRLALYAVNSSCLTVGAWVSNATPMWVGFSFFITSNSELAKPSIAEVFNPFDVMRGFLLRA